MTPISRSAQVTCNGRGLSLHSCTGEARSEPNYESHAADLVKDRLWDDRALALWNDEPLAVAATDRTTFWSD